MFSLANVLGKSQKYKVCKLQALISCSQCQHLSGAVNVTSAQLNSEAAKTLGPGQQRWVVSLLLGEVAQKVDLWGRTPNPSLSEFTTSVPTWRGEETPKGTVTARASRDPQALVQSCSVRPLPVGRALGYLWVCLLHRKDNGLWKMQD